MQFSIPWRILYPHILYPGEECCFLFGFKIRTQGRNIIPLTGFIIDNPSTGFIEIHTAINRVLDATAHTDSRVACVRSAPRCVGVSAISMYGDL